MQFTSSTEEVLTRTL